MVAMALMPMQEATLAVIATGKLPLAVAEDMLPRVMEGKATALRIRLLPLKVVQVMDLSMVLMVVVLAMIIW
jgi:hypothetical protein